MIQKRLSRATQTSILASLRAGPYSYCKGPSGEQLEFNQVRLKAKELFAEAKEKYYEKNKSE